MVKPVLGISTMLLPTKITITLDELRQEQKMVKELGLIGK